MKLLFVNFCIPGFAGDAVQLQYIIHGLEDLGHDVTLVVPDGDPFYFDKLRVIPTVLFVKNSLMPEVAR